MNKSRALFSKKNPTEFAQNLEFTNCKSGKLIDVIVNELITDNDSVVFRTANTQYSG